MMDTAKLLAELDESDAICAAATAGPFVHGDLTLPPGIDPHIGGRNVVSVYRENRDERWVMCRTNEYCAIDGKDAARIAHSLNELPARNQQLRSALARIAELEAVVVPLERLLRSGGTVCIDIDDGEYCVEPYSTKGDIDAVDYRGKTLAEALSAAVKAMEDAT